MKPTLISIVGVSLSLACLWFFRAFRKLLFPSDHRYIESAVPQWYEYAALLLCVICAFGVFFALIGISQRVKNIWARRAFELMVLGLGLAAFGSLSGEIITFFNPHANRFVNTPLPLIVLLLALVLSFKSNFSLETVFENFRKIALFFVPIALLLCANTLYMIASGGETPLTPSHVKNDTQNGNAGIAKNKVVWVIFDELDYSSLNNLPDDVHTPAFDRLKDESFVAAKAFSPDMDTLVSIPALLTGIPLRSTEPISASDIQLVPADGSEPVRFSDSSSIFTDLQSQGVHTGVLGWYHPFSRLVGNDVSEVSWYSSLVPPNPRVVSNAVQIFFASLESVPGMMRIMPFLKPRYRETEWQAERTAAMRSRARQMIVDRSLGFNLLHFSVPHAHFIDRNDQPAESYFKCIEAADRILGELREELERTGQWTSTALIVTSDHWWRHKYDKENRSIYDHVNSEEMRQSIRADIRIPFIVKLPNDSEHIVYDGEFNTVITRKLLNTIISGEITNNRSVGTLIDQMKTNNPELTDHRAAPADN